MCGLRILMRYECIGNPFDADILKSVSLSYERYSIGNPSNPEGGGGVVALASLVSFAFYCTQVVSLTLDTCVRPAPLSARALDHLARSFVRAFAYIGRWDLPYAGFIMLNRAVSFGISLGCLSGSVTIKPAGFLFESLPAFLVRLIWVSRAVAYASLCRWCICSLYRLRLPVQARSSRLGLYGLRCTSCTFLA